VQKISQTRVKHAKSNTLKWLQLLGSQFVCLVLFQTAKNRMHRNCHAKGYEFKPELRPENFQ